MDFTNPSSYTLRQTFKPIKASQKFGAKHKMALAQLLAFMKLIPGRWKFTNWLDWKQAGQIEHNLFCAKKESFVQLFQLK